MSTDYIFQGSKKLYKIYLDGELIWTRKEPTELNVMHSDDIPFYIDQDVALTIIKWIAGIHEVELRIDDEDSLHVTSLGVPSIFHEVSISDVDYGESLLTVADLILCNRIVEDLPTVVGEPYLTCAEVITNGLIDAQQLELICSPFALSAAAISGYHTDNLIISLKHFVTGVAAVAVSGAHRDALTIILTHLGTGIAAVAVSGAHRDALTLFLTHLSTGVAAPAIFGAIEESLILALGHLATGVAAVAVFGTTKESLALVLTHLGTGVAAVAVFGTNKTNLKLYLENFAAGMTATAIVGCDLAALRCIETHLTTGIAALSILAYGLLNHRITLTTYPYLTSGIVRTLYTSLADRIKCEFANYAGALQLANFVGVASDTSGLPRLAVDANLTIIRFISFVHHLTFIAKHTTFGVIGGFPELEYPIQTDTDLFIPQFYTAVQTGTLLEL